MTKLSRSLSLVLPLLVFSSMTLQAKTPPDITTAVSASEDAMALDQGSGYWTPERVHAAQPVPWDITKSGTAMTPEEAAPLGPPESAPGGLPSLGKTGRADLPSDTPEPTGAVNTTTDGLTGNAANGEVFGTQDIYDSDVDNLNTLLWKQYPYVTIGKLMFNTGSYCTASVISPNNIIVTAAHCCYDRSAGRFNSNFAFIPALRANTQPYGTFPYTQARVLTAWITGGTEPTDVCVLSLGPNASGQRVSSVTGWLGRSWNFPIIQHHFAFGYPGNINSGQYLAECAAESYANCGNGDVYAMGCNMTFGSSGGPWIRVFKKFQAGAMNYVNSVVHGYDSCTGTFGQSFNGARFTSNNIVPLCNAQGC